MKRTSTLLALVASFVFTSAAAAQDIAGSWQVDTVGDAEPPKGATLTFAFGGEDRATITYTLSGDSQSWDYAYTVADGQLTLEPIKAFGEPTPVVYDIKIVEGELRLLTPKPKPIEDDADAAETQAEEGGEAADEEAEAEAEEPVEEEVEEEQDERVPVWVLTKA